MRDTYRVILTADAVAHLKGIAEFVRSESPELATFVADRITGVIDSLSSLPSRFRRVGRSRRHETPVHLAVSQPFLVYYRVDDTEKTVHVLFVIHGRRRQPRRFP